MRYLTFLFIAMFAGMFILSKSDFNMEGKGLPIDTPKLKNNSSCSQDIPEPNPKNLTKICIPKPKIDFESVGLNHGDLKHTYEFYNGGNAPLIITNIRGNGGHMPSRYPRDPIPVGGKGLIETTFATKGKQGTISSRWMITANTIPAESYLNIRADLGYCSNEPQSPNEAALSRICIPKKALNLDTLTACVFNFDFEIYNDGTHPLVVKAVKGSGGPASWPKDPIPPGEKATIGIVWYAKGRRGRIQTRWTIFTNTYPEQSYLKAKAYILKE